MEGQAKLRRRALLRGGLGLGVAALGLDAVAACGPQGSLGPTATALPPPETTSLQLSWALCDPPFWMANDFLREEGFTGAITGENGDTVPVVLGTSPIGVGFANAFVGHVDAGQPVVALAGIHPGCAELWARPGINSIGDLKGKTVALQTKRLTFNDKTSPDTLFGFFVTMLAWVGIEPAAVNFVELGADANLMNAFVEGKSDVFLARAQQGTLLRANPKNPGKLILDTTMDKPWSQVYCCLLLANRNWVTANPVAAKRATRAILRSADAVTKNRRSAPSAAIATGLFKESPAITEQVVSDAIKDLSFDWREYDPEEAIRFFALRLNDAKLIKKTPQEVVTAGTDLAWFRQLRKELKA